MSSTVLWVVPGIVLISASKALRAARNSGAIRSTASL